MAWWVKFLLDKPEELSPIPGTQKKVGRENQLLTGCPLTAMHVLWNICAQACRSHTQNHNWKMSENC